jgi:hypothetical protein
LLEANANAIRRREERIAINEESKRKLSLAKEECTVVVNSVPRHCVVRDLSFSGARVVLIGLSQFLNGKESVLRLEFNEPSEIVSIKGSVVSADLVPARKDVCIASLKFDESTLPLSFKMHLNDYLTSVRKIQLSAQEQLAQQRAAQEAQLAAKQQEAEEQAGQTESSEGEKNEPPASGNAQTTNLAPAQEQS